MNPITKTTARLLTTLANLLALIPTALAEETTPDPCANPTTTEAKLKCLLPTQETLIEESTRNEGSSLATGNIATDFIPFFVNTGLSVAGTLIFISFIYAGFLLVFMNDNDENVEKGKKIMIFSVVGAVVMAIAYAVVYGIVNLQLD